MMLGVNNCQKLTRDQKMAPNENLSYSCYKNWHTISLKIVDNANYVILAQTPYQPHDCHFRWMLWWVGATDQYVKSWVIFWKFLCAIRHLRKLEINLAILIGSGQECLGMPKVHRNNRSGMSLKSVEWLTWSFTRCSISMEITRSF